MEVDEDLPVDVTSLAPRLPDDLKVMPNLAANLSRTSAAACEMSKRRSYSLSSISSSNSTSGSSKKVLIAF